MQAVLHDVKHKTVAAVTDIVRGTGQVCGPGPLATKATCSVNSTAIQLRLQHDEVFCCRTGFAVIHHAHVGRLDSLRDPTDLVKR